ncbi:glycosyltransferase family 2 protein [Haloglycomyces albus]|uniref:glycosyltransferase family 2 protein n=1 Tax=Haloglycomyces albus TaxID=526067 RepID=UPI0004AD7952|nr:cellulose synthase catalytic subunit [Haloglycomyces albus]
MSQIFLPTPPDDGEIYSYLGPQQRWVLLGIAVSYLFTATSLFLFSLRHPLLWMFLVVLGANMIAWSLALLDGQRSRRTTRTSHRLLVHGYRPHHYPSVDVLLPTCGEDFDILRNTYRHVAAMRWHGPISVYVLDDSDRPEVAALAATYGFHYDVRDDRPHLKKSGNINHGYRVSNGEFIAVFDADFCPRDDFLYHLMPYFADPDTAIVQSPQYFRTTESMGWLEKAAGAAQELFYRWIQPSRDADHAAICCGSCVVYRRHALRRLDGFPRMEHSEDMFTSIELSKFGWQTAYVPVNLATGASPDTVTAYVNQQYRWAMGNLELLVDRRFHRRRMPLRTRLCFWNGFASYIVNAVNVFAVPIPAIIMATAYADQVRPWHMVAFIPTLWVWFVLLPAAHKTKWRLNVVRAQLLYSYTHVVAIWHLIRKRTASWTPTGTTKKRNRLATTVARLTVVWSSITLLSLWGSLIWAAAQYDPYAFWPAAVFICIHTVLHAPLIGAAWKTLRPVPAEPPTTTDSLAHREKAHAIAN